MDLGGPSSTYRSQTSKCSSGRRLWSARLEMCQWIRDNWTRCVTLTLPTAQKIGHSNSITRNYYPEVQRQLADVANVYLFAASTSIGDSRLPHQLDEFSAMEAVPFKVVHFNNGMHGWPIQKRSTRSPFRRIYTHCIRSLQRPHSFGRQSLR
jgi:hypothetical protein